MARSKTSLRTQKTHQSTRQPLTLEQKIARWALRLLRRGRAIYCYGNAFCLANWCV